MIADGERICREVAQLFLEGRKGEVGRVRSRSYLSSSQTSYPKLSLIALQSVLFPPDHGSPPPFHLLFRTPHPSITNKRTTALRLFVRRRRSSIACTFPLVFWLPIINYQMHSQAKDGIHSASRPVHSHPPSRPHPTLTMNHP